MIKDNFKLAAKNLTRRKLRAWLTIVGIMISIAIIFILVSLSIGLNEAIQEQFRQLGTDKFFIQAKGQAGAPGSGGAVELTLSDAEVIRRVAGVKGVSYNIYKSVKVQSSDEIRFVYAMGLPLDKANFDIWVESGFIKMERGRILASGDSKKVMVGSQYYHNKFFSRPVDVGEILSINGTDFRVVGVLQTLGNPSDDKTLYLPIEDMIEIFPELEEHVDQMVIQVTEDANMDEVVERVNKKLLNHRNIDEKNKDFTILTPEDLLASFGTILNILTGFLLGVAAISLLVGAIGVTNTMYTSVLERTREIGVMKAVGAKNSDILQVFTMEAGLLGLIGGLTGVILGIITVKTIEFIAVNVLATNLLKAAIPWYLVLGCLVFAFLIGSLSGAWPAWKAAQIKPVDALRYE